MCLSLRQVNYQSLVPLSFRLAVHDDDQCHIMTLCQLNYQSLVLLSFRLAVDDDA